MFLFSSRRRHTSCALVTGVQTCALPISGDIVAVVHGPATPIVAINPDNPNLALIAALQEAGVTVAICSQAMNRAELSADDLAPGVRVDAAAITTLTNLQLRGWAVVYD